MTVWDTSFIIGLTLLAMALTPMVFGGYAQGVPLAAAEVVSALSLLPLTVGALMKSLLLSRSAGIASMSIILMVMRLWPLWLMSIMLLLTVCIAVGAVTVVTDVSSYCVTEPWPSSSSSSWHGVDVLACEMSRAFHALLEVCVGQQTEAHESLAQLYSSSASSSSSSPSIQIRVRAVFFSVVSFLFLFYIIIALISAVAAHMKVMCASSSMS